MDGWDGPEEIELVARRIEVIEALADEPRRKRDVVDDLSCSRSTLDRAVRRLSDAGLLERVPEGYVATLSGRLCAERYRAFVAEERAVLGARSALSTLPPDANLPVEALSGADVLTADGRPHELFETVVEHLRTADRYRAVLPELTDTRHLRLCHGRVVRDALDVVLLLGPDLVERLGREFPELADGLASAASVEIAQVDPLSYGLCLADSDGDGSVLILIADEGTLQAVVRTDDPAALRWARAEIDRLEGAGRPVADRLRTDESTELDAAPLGEAAALEDAGFRRIDREYLASRVPGEPARGWRTGFDVVDVYYGHAFERRARPASRSGTPRSEEPGPGETNPADSAHRGPLVPPLVDRLREGVDHVVLGPPGVGKSTVCRAVACRWVDDGTGDVLYRATPASGGIDRVGHLTDAVERDSGHTLVVVEDAAADGVAPAVGRLLDRYRDDPDVTFLLEAREGEWTDATESVDPGVRELGRGTLTEYRPPRLDESECERAIEAFETATGRPVPLSADDLLDRVRTDGGIGELYLLGYHLTSATSPLPWRDSVGDPTGLDDDVAAAYDALVGGAGGGRFETEVTLLGGDPSLPGEVGVLVATLTAAELPVTPGLVHALAAERDVDESPPHAASRDVDRVLDWLEGRMVFARAEGEAYRTHNSYWGVRFLEHAIERSERESRALFERALSAVFALADDADRRDAVENWLGSESSALDRLADPDGASEFVESVFDLAERHAELAPLFETSDRSGVALPGTCSTATRLACSAARFTAWYDYGAFDRAVDEAEWLRDRATAADFENDEETRARYVARAHRGLGEIAEDRGDLEEARTQFREALSVTRDVGDERGELKTLNALGWVDTTDDDYESAREHLSAALDIGENLELCPELTTTQYYLGNLEWFRGDHEAAARHLRRARELDRELGDRKGEAVTLNALGLVAEDRGALDDAEEYYRASLAIKRETRMRSEAAVTLFNLGDLLVSRGDLDAGADCLERSLAEIRDLGMDRAEGNVLGGFGRLELERGNHERAREQFERQREIHGEFDFDRGVAGADRGLGDVARDAGELDTAVDRYEASYERFERIDAPGRALEVADRLVDVADRRDDREAAVEWCETGREMAADAGLDDRAEAFTEQLERLRTAVDD